jgi:hypothetical protein
MERTMMNISPPYVGDRIRLIRHYLWYPAGRLGTITHIYRFDHPTYHPAYRIQFDGRTDDDIVYDDRFEVIVPPHKAQA